MKRNIVVVSLTLLGAFLLMQLVPYRVSNPSVKQEPKWDSPRTRALAVAACYDCHSNEVETPWYGKVAPVKWLLAKDVNEGRGKLNFSEWEGSSGRDARHASEAVLEGSMPPSKYTWFGLHSDAKLTPAERAELAQGLRISLER